MRKVYVSKLRPGMILAKSVYGPNGQLWLRAGVTLTEQYVSSLRRSKITFVYVFDPFLSDIKQKEIVSDQARIEASKAVKKLITGIRQGKQGPIVDNRFIKVVNKLIEEVFNNKDIMYNLADILTTDDYTFNHSVNVCILSLLIASNLRFTRSRLQNIAVGALLHDIGKCELSSSILLKQDKLSHSERHIIKKHSILSEQILQLTGYSDEDAKIVRYHHEKLDGSGYPYGITKIPLEQIISKKKLGIYGVFAIRTYFPKRFSPASLALLLLSYFSLADWYSCPSSGLFFALAQSLFACFFQ